MLGPPHLAAGARTNVYSATGSGEVALPKGRYRVTISHGLDHDIATREAEVTSADGAILRHVLPRVLDTSTHLACDFHLHAAPSGDSAIPLSDRVVSLVAEGVQFAVATDHNHVTDYAPAVRALESSAALATEIGAEVTTARWGHFNVFPWPKAEPLPDVYAPPIDLFAALRIAAPGVIVQVNHPRMPVDIGYFDLAQLDTSTGVAKRAGYSSDFDTIEVFNGFELDTPAVVEKNLADFMALVRMGRRVTAVGNSDSHRLDTQYAGYPRTYVEVGEDAAPLGERVAAALRGGRAYVTNGPTLDFTVNGGHSGDRLQTERVEADVLVRVNAAAWVPVNRAEIWVNGVMTERVAIASTSVERLVHSARVPLSIGNNFVMVIVRGSTPLPNLNGLRATAFAFTNPVYVERR